MKINFFLFLWVIFVLLDPDLDPVSGSRYGLTWLNPDPIRFRIKTTGVLDMKLFIPDPKPACHVRLDSDPTLKLSGSVFLPKASPTMENINYYCP